MTRTFNCAPFSLSSTQVPIKPKSVELFNPLDGEDAFASSIIHLLESSLVVFPFTKMRNVARDITVVVDGVVLHQFFISLIQLDFLGQSPCEVDRIENHHLIGCQLQEFFVLFPHLCLQVFVGLRPDFFRASVLCKKEEILEEALIEAVGITLVGIAQEDN